MRIVIILIYKKKAKNLQAPHSLHAMPSPALLRPKSNNEEQSVIFFPFVKTNSMGNFGIKRGFLLERKEYSRAK